eukprot:529917_1
MSKRKGKIHGYKGDANIQVSQRLPKSVVNFIIKATPSLQSTRAASATKNSLFIDNFFNSRSRQETFRICNNQHTWANHGLQHVRMEKSMDNELNKSILNKTTIDSDLFGLTIFRNKRYNNKTKSFKWKLKNNKKHNKFIKDCIIKEKQILTIRKVMPLYKLWNKYANDVMITNGCSVNNETKRQLMKIDSYLFNDIVSKLDLHGCLIKIIKCKSRKYYENCEGIVVFISKNRMCVVTSLPEKNKLICVPLTGTEFTFELCQRAVTVYGHHYKQFVH